MSPEKLYELVVQMISIYDPDIAGQVAAHPDQFLDCGLPYYSAASAILVDCQLRMDKSAASASVVAAAKRICKSALASSIPGLQGMFFQNGYYCLCDGYRILRLKSDVTALPRIRDGSTPPDVEKIMKPEIELASHELVLPDLADLKCYLARWKATCGKNEPVAYAILNAELFVNPQFLLDMMQALPYAKAYINPDRIGRGMIYFKAANGDGVLLPVHPNAARTL